MCKEMMENNRRKLFCIIASCDAKLIPHETSLKELGNVERADGDITEENNYALSFSCNVNYTLSLSGQCWKYLFF